MPQFRKKPVEIEAIRFHGWTEENDPVFDTDPTGWLLDAMSDDGPVRWESRLLWVRALEGSIKASAGDWIIRGVKGELYPCKPDVFAATYEAM